MTNFKINKKILKYIKPIAKSEKEFVFKAIKNNKKVFIYGCVHSNDIKNKHYKIIKIEFEKFIKSNKNVIVITEGKIPENSLSLEEITKKHKESGFVFKLAYLNKIKTVNIEPESNQLLDFLLERKNKKINILSWIFDNIVKNQFKNKKTIGAEDLAKIYKQIKPVAKYLGVKKYRNLSDKRSGSIKKIYFEINLARDYFMTINILSQITKEKSIFGAIGNNHIISQLLAFKKTLKKRGYICTLIRLQ